MLLLPKLLAVLRLLADADGRRRHGGAVRLTGGFAVETVLSALLAPLFMVYHSCFVGQILIGQAVGWTPQRRRPPQSVWAEAARAHRGHTALGVGLGLVAWLVMPALFWWLAPALAGLVLSIPLSVLVGSATVGRAVRRLGLLTTGFDRMPPPVSCSADRQERRYRRLLPAGGLGLLLADPAVTALHLALLPAPTAASASETAPETALARQRLLHLGWAKLAPAERLALIADPPTVEWLHRSAWQGLQSAAIAS
jgi:membrane glycosyltransferase